jgi:predicted secreted protein
MNQSAILVLAFVFSSIMIVSGSNICNNAPCESQINANFGEEFTISLESNPSIDFEWWTKFDPNYLSLSNSTFVRGNEISGKKLFTFNTRSAGNTEVIMLLLRPWENGTIAERKIFPINIISTAATTALKQATVPGQSETPKLINISLINVSKHVQELGYQEPSVMEMPAQIINRNIQAEKNPNLRGNPESLQW